MSLKSHKGKADMKHPEPPKWRVTTTDKSDGVVMDTARAKSGKDVYRDEPIGPQSKTGFGKGR